MKNIISTIKKLVSEDVVNESFLKYIDLYIIKNDKNVNREKVTNRFHSQLQVNFAFDELSKHYSEILSQEVEQITQEIEAQEKNNEEDFKYFLHVNYKELMSMFNKKKAIKSPPFNFDDPEFNSNYIVPVMELVAFYLRKTFVIPLLNYIESNYIGFLMDDCIFPLQIKKLIKEFNNHNLTFETLKNDEPKPDKYCPVFSERNNCSYYLSYNKFIDLASYSKHLSKVVSSFEENINLTIENIERVYDRINLLNQIRLKIKSSILLFSKLPNCSSADKKSLPQYARNDTNAIFTQLIIESFSNLKVVQFSPSIFDFQDLQHSFANEAYVFIKTKLCMLQECEEFKNEESKSSGTNGSYNIFHDKIKTNLTVPQLAFLFKCLYEEKDILDEKNKTALRQSISSCFTSKRKEDISTESIRKYFNSYDDKTIDFWIEIFTHMKQFAIKERENKRS